MKHLIRIESTAHGVLGVRHTGLDNQYCEAGELVILKWQPDAGWGLQEAHYTDKDGNVTAIGGGSFTMPNKGITIGGTFKRFVVQDWTGDVKAENVTAEGDVKAENVTAEGDVKAGHDVEVSGNVTVEGNVTANDVSAKGNVSADGNVSAAIVTAREFLVLKDTDSSELCKVYIEHGQLVIIPL